MLLFAINSHEGVCVCVCMCECARACVSVCVHACVCVCVCVLDKILSSTNTLIIIIMCVQTINLE